MCSVVDYVNPAVPGRITTLDIKRSGAGPALDVLIAMGQTQPARGGAGAPGAGPAAASRGQAAGGVAGDSANANAANAMLPGAAGGGAD
jgi:hypothetical protein